MKSVVLALGIAAILTLPQGVQATTGSDAWPAERMMNLSLGVGGAFNPNQVFLMARGEYQVDRFFAVGPMVEFGFMSGDTLLIPTMGGRFILPVGMWEFSLGGGIGASYRNENGFNFLNFVYQGNAQIEYFASDAVSIGLGTVINITSSDVRRMIPAVYAGVSYHH